MPENVENIDFDSFFDTDVSDADFFSAEEEEAEATDPKTNPESPQNPQKPEDSREEEEEEENLFDETEEEEEGGDPEELSAPEEEEESQSGKSLSTLELLKEKGLIDYELEEGEVLDEAKAEELLEDTFDTMFEDRISELFDGLPDIVKQMNKFVIDGGEINDFFSTLSKQSSSGLKEGMDLEEEANQVLVVRNGLAEEGYDEDYIEAQIEFLKDSNRLKKHSETLYDKWDTKNKAEKSRILASQTKEKEREKELRRELKNKVSTFLTETEEITGFAVTKEDRRTLPTYMSDRTVKLENGSQVTTMQRDLMKVLKSPTGSVQLAKLVKAASAEGELNFTEVQKETETKVAKKVRENVRRNKNSIISQSGKVNKKIRLADYFN